MKNHEVLNLYNQLSNLTSFDIKLPAVVNFARNININRLRPIVDEFNETKDNLLRTYGVLKEGSQVEFTFETDDNERKYYEELGQLMNTNVDVELQRFNSDALFNLEVTPAVFDILMLFATEG